MEKILDLKLKMDGLCIRDCGLADYREILRLQQELHEKRREGHIPDTVLIVEHPPVITLGARIAANNLHVGPEELANRGVDLVEVHRGGGATAHNPGQLVFYPILRLQELGLGINEYIRKLETIGIELLAQLGVRAKRQPGFPGLWVTGRAPIDTPEREQRNTIRLKPDASKYEIRNTIKIASVGVRVSKGVTYHGMAINIQNDLSIFDFIVPCGLDGVEMTSVLRETAIYHQMAEVKKHLSTLLIKHLNPPEKPPTCQLVKNTKYDPSEAGCKQIQNTIRLKPDASKYERRATSDERRKLPPWLRRPLPATETFQRTQRILTSLGIETICSNANCPNRGECWSHGTATVLILGNVCTRRCGFCSVGTGKPLPPNPLEPSRIAEMAKQMGLKYLVITSVDRDDLVDGGAGHFSDCITEVRRICPETMFEILTPDFRGCQEYALRILRQALPFVFAHNVETAPSLYPVARPGGDYQRSLNLLRLAKEIFGGIQTKSSIMLGLGETDTEIEQVFSDLRDVGCDRLTIGQYLKPSRNSLEVVEYIDPAKFELWGQKAADRGFRWVISSPFARSSYLADMTGQYVNGNTKTVSVK